MIEDGSRNGPNLQVRVSLSRFIRELSTEETSYMMTGFHEGIPYCLSRSSSGKQQMRRIPQVNHSFKLKTPLVSIEVDLILMDFQQLMSNSNSAYFNSNIFRVSKLSKSLTTTMPIFDGKSEKFELFEISPKRDSRFTIS